jgi:hypothetical protein
MIDADVWRDAHEYHRDQIKLHHLALHGWGIVQGLEVSLVDGSDNTLRISPGIGIDPSGSFIIVAESQTYRLMTRERGTVFLVLQFREVLAEPTTNGASPGQPTRVLEAYRIQERDRLPNEPYIELARVELDPSHGAVRSPKNAKEPGVNELDLRARVEIGSAGPPVELRAPQQAPVAPPPPVSVPAVESAPVAEAPVNGVPVEQVEAMYAQLRELAEQTGRLGSQVESLAGQARSPAQDGSPALDALSERMQVLTTEVDSLSVEVQTLSRQLERQPTPVAPTAAAAPDRPALRIALVDHSGPGWEQHRTGVRWLVRQVNRDGRFAAQAADPVAPAAAASLDVLYICGYAALSLSDAEVDAINSLLEHGGVLLGEGCPSGPNGEAGAREFALAFVNLATRLGHTLTRVDRTHALMTAEHLFGEAPAGARATARLLESGGIVYSDADYGCAWQGGPADHPLARGTIRDALEFGVNLAVFRRGAQQ